MAGRLIFDEYDRVGEWVAKRVNQTTPWGGFIAIGAERNGEIVSGIVMNNYNGVNATCHLAIDKPGKDMIELFVAFCSYAFLQCGLKRITAMVPLYENKVIEFDQRLGWEKEFVMRSAADDGGDMQVFVMWPEKCPWLKGVQHG